MSNAARLQVIGPTFLFAGFLVEEIAAQAWSLHPSSRLLWTLNLELLAIFHAGHSLLDSFCETLHGQTILVGLPLLLTAYYGLIRRCRFSLALASNRIPAHSAAPAAITSFDVVDLPAVPKGATIPASQINSQNKYENTKGVGNGRELVWDERNSLDL